jgi:hypothetical protein
MTILIHYIDDHFDSLKLFSIPQHCHYSFKHTLPMSVALYSQSQPIIPFLPSFLVYDYSIQRTIHPNRNSKEQYLYCHGDAKDGNKWA